jgi:hypothetical protein
MLPLSHINAKFFLDGDVFDVDHFNIKFEQPTDFRGQPQHEIGGGQLTVSISQAPTSGLYLWAKTSTQLKSGKVLFQTDLGITVLTVEFSNAYCINLLRHINTHAGTNTVLIISPEKVKMNGIEHDNSWEK